MIGHLLASYYGLQKKKGKKRKKSCAYLPPAQYTIAFVSVEFFGLIGDNEIMRHHPSSSTARTHT